LLRERHTAERPDGELSSGRLQQEIEHGQRVIEGQNFEVRRTLVRYSAIVELQRLSVQEWREAVMEHGTLLPLDADLLARGNARFGVERFAELLRRATLYHIDRLWSEHLAWIEDTRESIHLVSLGGKTPVDEFRKLATTEFLELGPRLGAAVTAELRRAIDDDGEVELSLDRLKGPSSTWTYLVSDEPFGFGVGLLQSRNLGQAAATGLYLAPLLVITLLLDRLKARRKRPRPARD
jgi:preprotein translocase subunit SecA